jgi:hypothetical protein
VDQIAVRLMQKPASRDSTRTPADAKVRYGSVQGVQYQYRPTFLRLLLFGGSASLRIVVEPPETGRKTSNRFLGVVERYKVTVLPHFA